MSTQLKFKCNPVEVFFASANSLYCVEAISQKAVRLSDASFRSTADIQSPSSSRARGCVKDINHAAFVGPLPKAKLVALDTPCG